MSDAPFTFEDFGWSTHRPVTPEDNQVSWGDWGRGLAAGAVNVASSVPAVVEYATEGKVGGGARKSLEEISQGIMESTSPTFRRRAQAAFIPDEDSESSVWSEGLLGSLVAKGVIATPSIAATIIPGGIAAAATRSVLTKLGTEAAKATTGAVIAGSAATRGTAGILIGGQIVSEIYGEIDKLNDEKLAKQAPPFKALLDEGLSPEEARRIYKRQVAGAAPTIGAALGAAVIGAERGVIGRLAGEKGRGFWRGIGTGARREAVEEGFQEGTSNFLSQLATHVAGLTDFEWTKLLNNTIEGAAVGGLLGGLVGGATGIGTGQRRERGQRKSQPNILEDDDVTNLVTPEQQAALQVAGEGYEPYDPFRSDFEIPQTDIGIDYGGQGGIFEDAPSPTQAPPAASEGVVQTGVQPSKGVGTGVAAKPPENAPVGDKKNAPTRSKREYYKKGEGKGKGKAATPLVDPIASPDQQAALEQAQPEPPIPEGMVRVYHSGSVGEGSTGRWVSSNRKYAADYRADLPLHYLDLPASDPRVNHPDYPEQGISQGFTFNFEATPEEAAQLRPIVREQAAPVAPQPAPQQEAPPPAPIPVPVQQPAPTKPKKLTAKVRKQLQELGYTVPQITAMSPEQRTQIIANGVPALGSGIRPKVPEDIAALVSQRLPVSDELIETGRRNVVLEKLREQGRRRQGIEEGVRSQRDVSPQERARLSDEMAYELDEVAKDAQKRVAEAKKAAQEDILKETEAPQDEATEYKGKKGKAVLSKREKSTKNAQKIFDDNPPSDTESKGFSAGSVTTLHKRLRRMIDRAIKEKVRVPKRPQKTDTPAEWILSDARKLLRYLDEGKKPIDFINTFQAREFKARRGVFGDVRAERKVEAEVKAAVPKISGDVEADISRQTELSGDDRDPGGVISSDPLAGEERGSDRRTRAHEDVDLDTISEMDIEDVPIAELRRRAEAEKRQRREELRRDVVTPASKPEPKNKVLELIEKRLEKAQSLKEKGSTAGERKAATAAIERLTKAAEEVKKRRGVVTPASKPSEPAAPMPGMADSAYTEEVELMAALEELRAENDYRVAFASASDTIADMEQKLIGSATEQGTFGKFAQDVLGDVPPANRLDQNLPALVRLFGASFPGLRNQATILAQVYKRLQQDVKDVSVYIVPDQAYDAAVGKKNQRGHYSSLSHNIFIKESTYNDVDFTRVLLHEGVHAAFENAIWETPALKARLESLLADARNHARTRYNKGEIEIVRQYGLTNISEFVAEAFTNLSFQEFLNSVPVTAPQRPSTIRSGWDALKDMVRQVLGLPPAANSALEAIMRLGPRLEMGATLYASPMSYEGYKNYRKDQIAKSRPAPTAPSPAMAFPTVNADTFTNAVNKSLDEVYRTVNPEHKAPWLLKVRGNDSIVRASDRFFDPENNPVRKIAELLGKREKRAQDVLGSYDPVFKVLQAVRDKFGAERLEQFADLLNRESIAGVYMDRPLDQQKHLGKNALKGMWAKAQYPKLSAEFNKLEPELRVARRKIHDFFRQALEAEFSENMKNAVFGLLGKRDDAMAQRFLTEKETDADKDALGKDGVAILEKIRDALETKGPYVSLHRKGDHYITGTVTIKAPANAKKLSDNEFEFAGADARKRAIEFAQSQELPSSVRSVWVDKKTGETYFTDGDDQTKVLSQDTDAENRFRVYVENKFVDFKTGKRAAEDARAEAIADGWENVIVNLRPTYGTPVDSAVASSRMSEALRLLEKRKSFQELPASQQHDLRRALIESSVGVLPDSRVRKSRLPRKRIAGASTNIIENVADYAMSSANLLSRLEVSPEMSTALKQLNEESKDYSKEGMYGRQAVRNEIQDRVSNYEAYVPQGKFGPWVNRLMLVSFLDKLMSVGYSVINSTQTWMLYFPVLAGQIGPANAYRELSKAYSDMGAGGTLLQAGKATWDKARNEDGTISFFKHILNQPNITKAERAMLEELISRNRLGDDAGLELTEALKNYEGVAGTVDMGLGYLEGIARQLPRAVESINRTTVALAAYRSALQKGMSPEAALRKTDDMLGLTQFYYNTSNQPKYMKHPLLRMSLQFKKFPIGVYTMLGELIGTALKGKTKAERAEAAKSLGYMMAMHAAVAGTLGLPTEPFKALILASGLLGSGLSWDDYERWQRDLAADLFGKTAGEMITKGVTRGLPGGFSIDVSSRIGLNNLAVFREPRNPDQTVSWLAEMAIGAPGSLVTEWFSGVRKAVSGDYAAAAELLVPMKTGADLVRAVRYSTEGKKTQQGRPTMEPYSPQEAVIRTLGFTPGREAEHSARSATFYARRAAETKERTERMREWSQAKPYERGHIWSKIEVWNRNRPPEQRITRQELNSYHRRAEQETKQAVQGLRPSRRDTTTFDRLDRTYNY